MDISLDDKISMIYELIGISTDSRTARQSCSGGAREEGSIVSVFQSSLRNSDDDLIRG